MSATETSLNQLVKGAPPPNIKIPPVAPLPSLASASAETVSSLPPSKTRRHAPPNAVNNQSSHVDPTLSSLPSSPPQIYLNLLILEASLRSQYLHLRARRRINTFFLLVLALWNCFFIWALFLRPREDGSGVGGSVYWVVESTERLAFMGGVVTVLFVQATGQWERGIRWPRRWLGTTNRGLRGFNLRVVVVKGKWWRETLGHFAFLLPFRLWRQEGGSDWHFVEHENGHVIEEDLSKGGDNIMLLLLPKNFSSEFRENWEAYRVEYWERENERRSALKKKVKQNRRNKAREVGGWKWWTGLWRLAGTRRKGHDLEQHPHHHRNRHGVSEKSSHRRSLLRDGSHSRQSSRSSTPHLDLGVDGAGDNKPLGERVRRGSSVSSTASVRRGTKSGRRAETLMSPLTAADEDGSVKEKKVRKKEKSDSRPTTPIKDSVERISAIA